MITPRKKSEHESPFRLLFILAGSVFVIETCIMFLLEFLPPMPEITSTMLDATLLTGLLFPIFYFFSFRPLTENLRELREAEDKLKVAALAYSNSSEAMMVTEPDGTIVGVNPAFTHLTGYTREEALGRKPKILKSGHQDGEFYRSMWRQLETTGKWEGEIWNRRKNGEIFAEWLSINPIRGQDGSIHLRVAQFRDITKKKQIEEAIWRQANYDTLTELPNRHLFLDRLEQEIAKSDRTFLPLALIFIDLDRFKEVNDTFGHKMGDLLLKEAARRISRRVRSADTVARIGGDEFIVILSQIEDEENIALIARHIQEELALPFSLGEEIRDIPASLGIAVYPRDAADLDGLIRMADDAMYVDKKGRHNGFSRQFDSWSQTE